MLFSRAFMSSAPKVAFVLFAYNQERFIREACEAALAQTWQPLDIILSDDGSTDGTFAIMQEVAASYRGPHGVRLNRNEKNLGLIGHVNRLMELTDADFIVVAAGDDVSLPRRTELLVDAWLQSGRAARSVHSAVTRIDAAGRALGEWSPPVTDAHPSPASHLGDMRLVIGASHAWSREVFDTFGPITHARAYEDLVIAFRSMLLGELRYVAQPLVRYRVGIGNLSGQGADAKPTAWPERLHQRLKHLAVARDTFAQRRDDCLRVNQPGLAAQLEEKVRYYSAYLDGLDGHAPWAARRQFIPFFKARVRRRLHLL